MEREQAPALLTEKINDLDIERGWIGISFGVAELRYGPYEPKQIGEFLTRLMAGHEGPHPFFFTLEAGAIDDPVPTLLDLAKPDTETPAGEE